MKRCGWCAGQEQSIAGVNHDIKMQVRIIHKFPDTPRDASARLKIADLKTQREDSRRMLAEHREKDH